MAVANAPIMTKEALTLTSLGINPLFATWTMESNKYICVRETYLKNSIVIVDMKMPMQQLRLPITADSALMNPNGRILVLKAQLQGTTDLKMFDIEMNTIVKSYQMPEQVVFLKWITTKLLGLVTKSSVYHWCVDGGSDPIKMFERTATLSNNQIIIYRCDPSEKWLVLIGIAPGARERPQLVKGNMQLFSVDRNCSLALEAHAVAFASFKGSRALLRNNQTFSSDLFSPPAFADDFPVVVQISHKYILIYVIIKLGLLLVYDLETGVIVYRNRISSDPTFFTAEASSGEGFYAINRRGQVFLATVNEATIIHFVSSELNNLKLAMNLAKRGNLPEAENLASV